MRISTNMMLNDTLNNVDTSYQNYVDAQQELATGKKLNQPSDDPAGTSQALSLEESLGQLTQYAQNMNTANSFMENTDTALSSVTNLIQQARDLAVQSASDTISNTQRQNLAYQINTIITQIGALGNSKFGSRYLFGGQKATTPPFTQSNGSFVYQGGTAANGNANLTVNIGQGESIVTNVTGDQVFTGILSALTQLSSDMTNNNLTAISNNDLTSLDSNLSNITQARAMLGANVQRINSSLQRNSAVQENFTNLLSQVQDVDISKAAVQLQSSQLAYQAALTATSKGFQQSLLDYIK